MSKGPVAREGFGDDSTCTATYLPDSWTDEDLKKAFALFWPVAAKIVGKKGTGRATGYGFVGFATRDDMRDACRAMNGIEVSDGRYGSKAIKVAPAIPKMEVKYNTNVYMSGLPPNATEDWLHQLASPFGEVLELKLLTGVAERGHYPTLSGFVRFARRTESDLAIGKLHNAIVPGPKPKPGEPAPRVTTWVLAARYATDSRTRQKERGGGGWASGRGPASTSLQSGEGLREWEEVEDAGLSDDEGAAGRAAERQKERDRLRERKEDGDREEGALRIPDGPPRILGYVNRGDSLGGSSASGPSSVGGGVWTGPRPDPYVMERLAESLPREDKDARDSRDRDREREREREYLRVVSGPRERERYAPGAAPVPARDSRDTGRGAPTTRAPESEAEEWDRGSGRYGDPRYDPRGMPVSGAGASRFMPQNALPSQFVDAVTGQVFYAAMPGWPPGYPTGPPPGYDMGGLPVYGHGSPISVPLPHPAYYGQRAFSQPEQGYAPGSGGQLPGAPGYTAAGPVGSAPGGYGVYPPAPRPLTTPTSSTSPSTGGPGPGAGPRTVADGDRDRSAAERDGAGAGSSLSRGPAQPPAQGGYGGYGGYGGLPSQDPYFSAGRYGAHVGMTLRGPPLPQFGGHDQYGPAPSSSEGVGYDFSAGYEGAGQAGYRSQGQGVPGMPPAYDAQSYHHTGRGTGRELPGQGGYDKAGAAYGHPVASQWGSSPGSGHPPPHHTMHHAGPLPSHMAHDSSGDSTIIGGSNTAGGSMRSGGSRMMQGEDGLGPGPRDNSSSRQHYPPGLQGQPSLSGGDLGLGLSALAGSAGGRGGGGGGHGASPGSANKANSLLPSSLVTAISVPAGALPTTLPTGPSTGSSHERYYHQ